MALLPPPSPATKNPGWGQAGARPLAQEGPGSRWHQEGAAERVGVGAGRLGEGPAVPLPLWVVLAHLLALPGLHLQERPDKNHSAHSSLLRDRWA